jgi:Restriction endonuclease
MSRRKQKHLIEPKALISLLVVLGIIWFVARVINHLPSGSADAFALIIFLSAAMVITYPIVKVLRRARARQTLVRKARDVCAQQLPALARRHAQLVQPDPYGRPQTERWAKEIDYFIKQHIQPVLIPSEVGALARNREKVAQLIWTQVETAMHDQPPLQAFSDNMTPAEFEAFCAEELRRAGWDARVTMQSRDQGVDVVATKKGRRIVLQCKLYARPVGNKSVQEAVAARGHEKADFGMVVSNNRYTSAAEQLANTNGILLLHYRDLRNLEIILNQQTIP